MLGGDDYQNVYKSFDLKYVLIEKYRDDPGACFILKDSRDELDKRATICTTANDLKADQTIEGVKNTWVSHSHLLQLDFTY